jgi:hypothetical protein
MSSDPSHVEAAHTPATQLSPTPQSLLSSQQPGAEQTGFWGPGMLDAPAWPPASATLCWSTVCGWNSSFVSVHAASSPNNPTSLRTPEPVIRE